MECSVCKQDSELHGDGIYSIGKSELMKGQIPCGCSKSPKWSKEQYSIICERKCKELGLIFIGFEEEFKVNKTKVIFNCHKHGKMENVIINHLLTGVGCKSCNYKQGVNSRLNPEEDFIKKFIATGKFHVGYKFKRNELSKNAKSVWSCYCPICSNDEFTKAGLCAGEFKSSSSELTIGKLPCRCSKVYKYNSEQRQYQISEILKQGNCKFSCWDSEEGYINPESKFYIDCEKHGRNSTSFQSFFYNCNGCPTCGRTNQTNAYINIVYDNEIPIALKFGVANDVSRRLYKQNWKNKLQMETLKVFHFDSIEMCRKAESKVKSALNSSYLLKSDLEDGYSESVCIADYEKIVEIYEQHGGIEVTF